MDMFCEETTMDVPSSQDLIIVEDNTSGEEVLRFELKKREENPLTTTLNNEDESPKEPEEIELFRFPLSEDRILRIMSNGEDPFNTSIDIRQFINGKPSEKGQELSLMRWRNLVDNIEEIHQKLRDVNAGKTVNFRFHIGGNVYASVTSPYRCVNIRQFDPLKSPFKTGRKPRLFPTKFGVSLRIGEWYNLRDHLAEINFELPVDMSDVVPCHMSANQSNQEAETRCPECHPNAD